MANGLILKQDQQLEKIFGSRTTMIQYAQQKSLLVSGVLQHPGIQLTDRWDLDEWRSQDNQHTESLDSDRTRALDKEYTEQLLIGISKLWQYCPAWQFFYKIGSSFNYSNCIGLNHNVTGQKIYEKIVPGYDDYYYNIPRQKTLQ